MEGVITMVITPSIDRRSASEFGAGFHLAGAVHARLGRALLPPLVQSLVRGARVTAGRLSPGLACLRLRLLHRGDVGGEVLVLFGLEQVGLTLLLGSISAESVGALFVLLGRVQVLLSLLSGGAGGCLLYTSPSPRDS